MKVNKLIVEYILSRQTCTIFMISDDYSDF